MNEAEGVMCDQQYVIDLASGESRLVSTGKGRVTCGCFYRRDVHPNEESLAQYQERLAENLYRPGALEVWVMDADGGPGGVRSLPRVPATARHPLPIGRHSGALLDNDSSGNG